VDVGFAGEAHDEAGAQGGLREARAHALHHQIRVLGEGPAHGREDLRVGVLQGDVEIGHERPAQPGQMLQQRVREPGRVEIHEPQPLEPREWA